MDMAGVCGKALLAAMILAVAGVTGCGGGGEGSTGGGAGPGSGALPPAVGASAPSLTLTPSAVAVDTYEGESASFTIKVAASDVIAQRINAAIVDPRGVISPQADIDLVSPREYRATLKTAATLAAGRHATTVDLRLCEDDPALCKAPLAGSPWKLPVTVTVRPQTKSALTPIPGVAAWGNANGNAAHTGFVPASFVTAAFNRRWSSQVVDNTLSPIAVDNGKVFATRRPRAGKFALLALDEDTGRILWTHEFDDSRKVGAGAPAAAAGKVYLTTTIASAAYLWAFDQTSGAVLSKTGLSLARSMDLAPTVDGDDVYTFSNDGLAKVVASAGKVAWSHPVLYSDEAWNPALQGDMAYVYSSGILYAVRTSDGTQAFRIADRFADRSNFDDAAVAVGAGKAFVVDYRLYAFDLETRTVGWVSQGPHGGLAIAGDNVYTTDGAKTLEVRAAGTGELRWSLDLSTENERYEDVLVTASHVFVSAQNRTLAVDLATRKVVWSMPFGGHLALSNRGVLYAAGWNGLLVAVNLR